MIGLDFGVPPDQPLRLFCLGAHSDDIEIGCGGTIRRLVNRPGGLECRWMVFSGTPERAEEARRAAADLLDGALAASIDVLDFRESYFPYDGAAVKDAVQDAARAFTPHVVLTHYRDDRHQDHRVLSDLAWNAFRDSLVLEYEIPKWDGDMGRPNVYVPIGPDDAQRKITTIMERFATQGSKAWFDEETFWALLRIRGMECNSPSRFAEAFYGRKVLLDPARKQAPDVRNSSQEEAP